MKKNKDRSQMNETNNKMVNDYELIYLYNQGDEDALLILIKKYKRVSYLYIDRYYNALPKILDRHEMYQLSLVSLYNAILTYNEEKENNFSTYFSVILNHDLLMYIRRLKKEANRSNLNAISLDQTVRETEGLYLIDAIENKRDEFEPDKYVSFREMYKEIDEQLKHFNKKEQQAFYLWADGYTYQEIGDFLKIKRKKVEYIVKKIKGILKTSLHEWK